MGKRSPFLLSSPRQPQLNVFWVFAAISRPNFLARRKGTQVYHLSMAGFVPQRAGIHESPESYPSAGASNASVAGMEETKKPGVKCLLVLLLLLFPNLRSFLQRVC